MPQIIKPFYFILVLLGLFNAFAFLAGALDGAFKIPIDQQICDGRKTRWAYLFPGARLGCWMSERIE